MKQKRWRSWPIKALVCYSSINHKAIKPFSMVHVFWALERHSLWIIIPEYSYQISTFLQFVALPSSIHDRYSSTNLSVTSGIRREIESENPLMGLASSFEMENRLSSTSSSGGCRRIKLKRHSTAFCWLLLIDCQYKVVFPVASDIRASFGAVPGFAVNLFTLFTTL